MSTLYRWGASSTLVRDGLALALMLLLALAIPALASADEPFKSAFHEQFAASTCPAGTAPTTLCATVTGEGLASRLGHAQEAAVGLVDLTQMSATTGCAPVVATATLTAASGDTLVIRTTGAFCRGAGSQATDSGTFAILGGSGRFAHASGQGAYLTRAVFGQGFSGTSLTTMEGSLELR